MKTDFKDTIFLIFFALYRYNVNHAGKMYFKNTNINLTDFIRTLGLLGRRKLYERLHQHHEELGGIALNWLVFCRSFPYNIINVNFFGDLAPINRTTIK
jgi:hypothetical protein